MGNTVKKKGKIWKRIIVWFISLFAVCLISSPFSTTDASGNAVAPNWYYDVVLIVPIAIAIFYDKIKWRTISMTFGKLASNAVAKINSRKLHVDSENFIVPRAKKRQEALAEKLLKDAETYASLANKSDLVSLFIDWYDKALDSLSKLTQLNKVKFRGSPSYDYYRLKDEFQWHLCDAIVRAKEKTISDIKGKYKNSREFQKKALDSFERDINSVQSKFSKETSALADESIKEIREIVECRTVSITQSDDSIGSIDYMDGIMFENWCAGLLKKNGFANVKLTPASGDQGVDILAEKDGIRYAVQCKCYSSDLGNTPIQEVNTGKTVYRCQIGVVMTNRYFTKGAKDAADATGGLLWDRDKLKQMMES